MADQKHRAVVLVQQFFQQFQRVDVQVVGRLVQHQDVGGACKQPGQQQPVALATRQGAHWCIGAGRREQKVAQVAFDVGALAVDFDPLAAWADEVFQRCVQVNLVAHLVKVGHGLLAALAHRPFIRGQFAQDQFQQRGFARTVGADQADFVSAQNGAAEVAHHCFAASGGFKVFADFFEFGHNFSTGRAAGHIQLDPAHGISAGGAGFSQVFQPGDAALRAGAAGFHAFAYPHFFLSQQFVCPCIDHRLLGELLFFQCLVLGKVAWIAQQAAPIQIDHAGGHAIQKCPVVADDHCAALEIIQQALQPADGVQIQMVGGFIQQQHIGSADQCLCQGHAFFQAA